MNKFYDYIFELKKKKKHMEEEHDKSTHTQTGNTTRPSKRTKFRKEYTRQNQ